MENDWIFLILLILLVASNFAYKIFPPFTPIRIGLKAVNVLLAKIVKKIIKKK